MPEDYTFWRKLEEACGSSRKNFVVTDYDDPRMGSLLFDFENYRIEQRYLEEGQVKKE